MQDTDCIRFLQWALPRLGLRWPGFRRVRGQVCKRLGRRLAALALSGLAAYRARLEADPGEWPVLDALCRISISRFYRDRGIFDELARALPPLAAQARQRGAARLRIWSAGCASGEEPYTVALLLAFRMLPDPCQAEIVATDADPHLLARARRACYPPGSLRELPPGWQAAAFNAVGEERCLRPAYRNAVRFLEQDIRRERPDEHFDLILCRNLVFTYFAVPLQMRTVARLADALVPDGLLLLGSHESLPQAVPGLITERPWLYRRQP